MRGVRQESMHRGEEAQARQGHRRSTSNGRPRGLVAFWLSRGPDRFRRRVGGV